MNGPSQYLHRDKLDSLIVSMLLLLCYTFVYNKQQQQQRYSSSAFFGYELRSVISEEQNDVGTPTYRVAVVEVNRRFIAVFYTDLL